MMPLMWPDNQPVGDILSDLLVDPTSCMSISGSRFLVKIEYYLLTVLILSQNHSLCMWWCETTGLQKTKQ